MVVVAAILFVKWVTASPDHSYWWKQGYYTTSQYVYDPDHTFGTTEKDISRWCYQLEINLEYPPAATATVHDVDQFADGCVAAVKHEGV